MRAAIRRDELPPDLDPKHLRAMARMMRLGKPRAVLQAGVTVALASNFAAWSAPAQIVLGAALLANALGIGVMVRDALAADWFLKRPEMRKQRRRRVEVR